MQTQSPKSGNLFHAALSLESFFLDKHNFTQTIHQHDSQFTFNEGIIILAKEYKKHDSNLLMRNLRILIERR